MSDWASSQPDTILSLLVRITDDCAATRSTSAATAQHLAEHVSTETATWAAVRGDITALTAAIDTLRARHDDRLDKIDKERARFSGAMRVGIAIIAATGTVTIAVVGAALQVSHNFGDWVTTHFG